MTGHERGVKSVAFSPDGQTLASGSGDSTVRLWDVAAGTLRHTLENPGAGLYSVTFSPDGQTLATGGGDSTVRLWDVTAGTLQHTLESHGFEVKSVVFSPDGRTLASGNWDYTIRLWDIDTGILRHTLAGHTAPVRSVAFSPNGQTLASGSTDGTVLLWDVATGTGAPWVSGDFRNLTTNPDGHWEAWKSGTTVIANFSSPRAPVQYYARQDPQPQFVLPTDWRPSGQVTHTATGTRVRADRTLIWDEQPSLFDLTIGPNGEMSYVDNSKVDGLGYVDYRVIRLTWQTATSPETQCIPRAGTLSESGTDPGR